jgi:hypothetical protein
MELAINQSIHLLAAQISNMNLLRHQAPHQRLKQGAENLLITLSWASKCKVAEQKKASTTGVQFIQQHDNPNPSADPELFHDLGEVQIDTRKKVQIDTRKKVQTDTRKKVQTDTRKKTSAAAVALKSSPKVWAQSPKQ